MLVDFILKSMIKTLELMLNSAIAWRLFQIIPPIYMKCFSEIRPAFIMDGNRRYAKINGVLAKESGLVKFVEIKKHLKFLHIKEANFFVLSKANLGRPTNETEELFSSMKAIDLEDAKVEVIGDLTLLKQEHSNKIREIMAQTVNNSGIVLRLFVAYSPRCSCDATVDLIIRTGNTLRMSGFLLPQAASGGHLNFVSNYWPEFNYWQMILIFLKYKIECLILKRNSQIAKQKK